MLVGMNYVWFFLIFLSIIISVFTHKIDNVINAILKGSEVAVKTSLYLIGIMAFWLGIMKIVEKSGILDILSRIIFPIMSKLFPELKNDKKTLGFIVMNFIANALGLSNAATPIGIKAMQKMQEQNVDKNIASNSMCRFLAMNTAGFQLVPATVIAILAANNFNNPTQIIFPTLIVTSLSFIFAIFIVIVLEKISPIKLKKDKIIGDNND